MNEHIYQRMCLFVILLVIFTTAYSQYIIDSSTNGLRRGDQIVKQEIEYFPQGNDGENVIWDFSDMTFIGEYQIEYFNDKDSFITISLEPNCINKYSISKDTMQQIGYETALEYINYEPSIVLYTYPFKYGYSINTPFKGDGVYCSTNSIQTRGEMKVLADAYGSIILPQGDTIQNVLRIHSIKSSSVNMNILNDSTIFDPNNLKQIIEEHFQWFARSYRYPLFETINTTCYNNMEPVTNLKKAYCCLPNEQRQLKDSINEGIIIQDSLDGQNAKENMNIINYHVDVNGSLVTLTYSLNKMANISALLCNQMGFTFQSTSFTMPIGENYQYTFNCSGIRRGIYILYINVNGIVYSEKINIR